MAINTKESKGAIIIEITGEIDGKSAPEMQNAVLQTVRAASHILLDLTETTYMSSAGLRMLLLVHREAAAKAARLLLVGLRPDLKDVMSATGFLKFFTLCETVLEAQTLLEKAPA